MDMWKPNIGDKVFCNGHGLDGMADPYRVVGFVDKPEHGRHGQPILEYIGEEKTGFLAEIPGEQRICAPQFLWPYEWGEAVRAGKANYSKLGSDFDIDKWRETKKHPEMAALDACWRY